MGIVDPESIDMMRSILPSLVHRSTMRILLVDDERRIRSALKLLFKSDPGYTVVGEAETTNALIALVIAESPDTILLDWDLISKEGENLILSLKTEFPQLAILIISGRPEVGKNALEAGADAFFSKTDPPQRLLQTLETLEERRAA